MWFNIIARFKNRIEAELILFAHVLLKHVLCCSREAKFSHEVVCNSGSFHPIWTCSLPPPKMYRVFDRLKTLDCRNQNSFFQFAYAAVSRLQQVSVEDCVLSLVPPTRSCVRRAACGALCLQAIIGGMTSTQGGCDVADCGLCTTPAMFMVRRIRETHATCKPRSTT